MAIIDRPVKYGRGFEKPSAATIRKSRLNAEQTNGKRLFAPSEIHRILEVAPVPFPSMILLGLNGGFGNTDCARLPIAAVDFENAIIDFGRAKTGVERVVPLWSETVTALREVLAARPKPADAEADKLVFLTPAGFPWVRERVHREDDNDIQKVVFVDAICREFSKLIAELGMKRKGVGFYTLRHTFRTWADEVKDQHAIHRIMGHAIPGMSGIYVERISLDRLRAVVDHVHAKLFSSESQEKPGAS